MLTEFHLDVECVDGHQTDLIFFEIFLDDGQLPPLRAKVGPAFAFL
jgi:hypothetical protein